MHTDTATKVTGRTFTIEDQGDEFLLFLFVAGVQVAVANIEDDDGSGLAFHLAYEIGSRFVGR